MEHWIKYLSGNVPGGIFLYLLLLGIALFILLFLYRANELFTRRHLIRWSIISSGLITLLYLFLWLQHPPPRLVQRYGIVITSEDSTGQVLALSLNHLLGEVLDSHQGKGKYFFRPWWFHFGHAPCDSAFGEDCWRIVDEMPIHRFYLGQLKAADQGWELIITRFDNPGREAEEQWRLFLKGVHLNSIWSELSTFLEKQFPVRPPQEWEALLNQPAAYFQGRYGYYRNQLARARDFFSRVLIDTPQNAEARRWYWYCQIKWAGLLRAREGEESLQWKEILHEAQSALLDMVREDTAKALRNVRLNNLLGESFLLEERFDDAEPFLKQAYALDPYDVEVLANLVHLHPTRYSDLGFADRESLYEYLLTVCPLHEEALVAFADQKLVFGPHLGARSLRAREFLEKYLAMRPSSAIAWNLMGKYYYLMIEREKALRAFLRADSLDPDNPVIKFNIGAVYFHQNRLEEAEKYFRQAIALNDYLDAHLYLGEIYRRRNDCKRALEEFRYRVRHKRGEDDYYAFQAMKGIRMCLEAMRKARAGQASEATAP